MFRGFVFHRFSFEKPSSKFNDDEPAEFPSCLFSRHLYIHKPKPTSHPAFPAEVTWALDALKRKSEGLNCSDWELDSRELVVCSLITGWCWARAQTSSSTFLVATLHVSAATNLQHPSAIFDTGSDSFPLAGLAATATLGLGGLGKILSHFVIPAPHISGTPKGKSITARRARSSKYWSKSCITTAFPVGPLTSTSACQHASLQYIGPRQNFWPAMSLRRPTVTRETQGVKA